MSNIATIQRIYEAFSHGDGATIIEHVSDDVNWEHWQQNFAQERGVPYLLPRRGKAGVGEFLKAVATHLELRDMQVLNLLEGARQVAAVFTIEFVVKATGKRVRDEEIHLWTFDAQGRVIGLRHYVDTAKHIAASTPD